MILLCFCFDAFAAPKCPSSQPDIVFGVGRGGADWVSNILLRSSVLNEAKDIILCRYEGKRYQYSSVGSTKYIGRYYTDKFYTEGDHRKNNSPKGWNARIYGKDSKGNKKFACSAVIINPAYALTDKKCWEGADRKLDNFWIKGNVSNDSNDANSISLERDIVDVKFRTYSESGYGLALVAMSSFMILSEYPSLYYTTKDTLEGSSATFYGWGCDGSSYCHNQDKPVHELNKRVGREDDSSFWTDMTTIDYETANGDLFNIGDLGGSCMVDGFLIGIIFWTQMRRSEKVQCNLVFSQRTWIRDNSIW